MIKKKTIHVNDILLRLFFRSLLELCSLFFFFFCLLMNVGSGCVVTVMKATTFLLLIFCRCRQSAMNDTQSNMLMHPINSQQSSLLKFNARNGNLYDVQYSTDEKQANAEFVWVH